MKHEIVNAIDSLKTAKLAIGNNLTDPHLANLKGLITIDLDKHINYMSQQIGEEPLQITFPKSKPLTSILGKPIEHKLENTTGFVDPSLGETPLPPAKTPEEIAAEDVKNRSEKLYKEFLTTDTDQILDSFGEDVLRAVGKKAGLPVTDISPKKLDVAYIDQIKEAIKKKKALKAAKNAATTTTVTKESAEANSEGSTPTDTTNMFSNQESLKEEGDDVSKAAEFDEAKGDASKGTDPSIK